MKIEDIKSDHSSYWIGLTKITGKNIAEIEGYLSREGAGSIPFFQVTNVIMEDGSVIGVGGAHDCPYLEVYDPQPNMDDETLSELYYSIPEDER